MTATTYETTETTTLDHVLPKAVDVTTIAPATLWLGRGMSGLVVAFLLLASVFPKLFLPAVATESMHQLGWPEKHLVVLGLVELFGTLLYAVPRTAALGAVLLTGLFGGAIASHLRIETPLWSHTLFPVYVGLLMWGGLWFRNARVRYVLPVLN